LVQATTRSEQYEIKSDQNWGQSFTLSASKTITSLQLSLRKDGAASSQTLTISLRSSWSGTPVWSTTVQSSTLTNNNSASNSANLILLSAPSNLLLNAGTYFIRISSNSTDGKVYARGSQTSVVSPGDLINKDGVAESGKELYFIVNGY
jgi:hypothetical protein